jgi:hypothetical protein
MSPVVDIFQTTELGIMFYRWDTIGPQYSKMQRSMSRILTTVRGWADQAKLMKLSYKNRWW